MSRTRIRSLDTLRGLVIILMILDHSRNAFFGEQLDATNLDETTVALFFTRWVTHFDPCLRPVRRNRAQQALPLAQIPLMSANSP